MHIMLIDNFDSFTYNLVHCFETAGAKVDVYRNNHRHLAENIDRYQALVISPGPSTPGNSGFSPALVKHAINKMPLFGICLGMQIINETFGGITARAPFPIHGKTSQIEVMPSSPIFRNLPRRFYVARYHSLICAQIPPQLKITAEWKGIPMALQHHSLPIFGVQFHPESFMSEHGLEIIKNFLKIIDENIS